MSYRWLTTGCVAAVVLGTLSCDAQVRIPDGDDESGGSTSAAGGAPTTSAAGGSSTGGSGGSEPDWDAEALVKAQCPEVGAESHFCVTLGNPSTLYAVGPDTGSICYLGAIGGLDGGEVSSIAVVGPNVHGCSENLGVWRAPVLGGPAEILPIECGALTGYQGGFLLSGHQSQNSLRHYANFESLGSDSELQSFDVDPNYSMTVRQDTLFAAWSSGDAVEVANLPTSTAMPNLQLEGFDDSFDGISATSDGRLYVLSSSVIRAFDVATGEQLLQTIIPAPTTPLTTLHCWTN